MRGRVSEKERERERECVRKSWQGLQSRCKGSGSRVQGLGFRVGVAGVWILVRDLGLKKRVTRASRSGVLPPDLQPSPGFGFHVRGFRYRGFGVRVSGLAGFQASCSNAGFKFRVCSFITLKPGDG